MEVYGVEVAQGQGYIGNVSSLYVAEAAVFYSQSAIQGG